MVKDLHFVSPESEGLDSKYIAEFVEGLNEYKINMHSFMLVKNGNIMFESYAKPFDKDFKHRLYSCSKTFVAVAVGLLIKEGKLSLTDKVVDFFPEYNKNQSKWMRELTVEDCLRMSVPSDVDSYFYIKDEKWARTFFTASERVKKPAGTVFNYNTSGLFILDCIVEKITGKKFLEYLRPVLDKIGISKDIWCVSSPEGYSWGGSGIVATMHEFASFGELLLNYGKVNGEQILPLDYTKKMLSKQIDNRMSSDYSLKSTCGYGYQTWITDSGFALIGIGGQFVFAFPDKNFMFVCNSDTQGSANANEFIYYLVKHLFYNNLGEKKLKENPENIKYAIKNFTLHPEMGENTSPIEEKVNGKVYVMDEKNDFGWKWFKIDFTSNGGTITYENKRGVKKLAFNKNAFLDTVFPESTNFDKVMDVPCGREFRCLTSGGWKMQDSFSICVYVIDNALGNLVMNFAFKKNEVGVIMSKVAECFLDDYVGTGGGELK